MEKVKSFFKNKKSIWISLAVIFLLMFVINSLTIWSADDYAFFNNAFGSGNDFSLSQITNQALWFYLNWTGRFLSTFLNYIFLPLNKVVFNIFNSLIYSLFIFIFYQLINKKKTANHLLLFLIFIATWFVIPAFGQVAFWQIGSVIYLWMFFLVILVTLLYSKLLNEENVFKNKYIGIIVISVLGILAGNGFETMGLMLVAFLTVLMFILKILQKRKLPIWAYFGYIFSIIGFLSNFLSPGNSVRMGSMELAGSFVSKIYYGIGSWFYNGILLSRISILIILIIIAYTIYLYNNVEIRKKISKKIMILGGTILSLFIIGLSSLCIKVFSGDISNFLKWYYTSGHLKFNVCVFILLILLLMIIFLAIFNRKTLFAKKDNKFNVLLFCLVSSSLLAVCSYIVTPSAWPRSYMGMNIYLLIVLFAIISKINIKMKKKVQIFTISFSVIAIIAFIYSYSNVLVDCGKAYIWQTKTDKIIKEEIKKGEEEIYVQTYSSSNTHNGASIEKWVIPIQLSPGDENATENGIHRDYEWINIEMTNYYFKDEQAWKKGKRIMGYE